ncbi:MAG: FAD-dependent oxidoreductase, partial [Deltaproteobacteria bacterium]|nr:FAD-dependent oxidoreductase [Deltaproteobacteria bacterium]
TGASPRSIPGIEVDGEVIHTSRTILEYKRLPQKMLIIGAGAIGVEFAYLFHALGTQITLVEMMDHILPVEDEDISRELEKIFKKQGMLIMTAAKVHNLRQTGKVVSASIETSQGEEKWSGDCCLLAAGVVPNSAGIGLEKAGIVSEKGFIKTDTLMATNQPHHFAIGDVAGAPLLAHKATHSGIIAAEAACGLKPHPLCLDNLPSCTYCQPQVASVGRSEKALKAAGIKFRVGKLPFSAIGKAVAAGEPEGFIKALICEESGEVLGLHIIQAEATELIAAAALVRSHEGTAQSVIETVFPHPTLSESLLEATALAAGRPLNF